MLEALVCTQDWLRWSLPIDIEENYEELTMLEQGTSLIHCLQNYFISLLHICTTNSIFELIDCRIS
jgi:hypothetical protein